MEKAHIPLSQRIRPDSEAPWVIEQVIQLENTIYSLQHQLDISVAFHKVAIKERDFERSRVEILQTEVERLRGLLPPTAHAGVRNGPGEGSWSVYAGKLAEERDTALAEAERLRAELDTAKADVEQLRGEYISTQRTLTDTWERAEVLEKELAEAKAASVVPVK